MDALPITIFKTIWGQVGIALSAIASIVVVILGFQVLLLQPGIDGLVVFGLATFIVALLTAYFSIWLRVYSISYLYLGQEGITVVSWSSLFVRQSVQAEWSDIEDVSDVSAGFLAQMLGFGSINVQTAGTRQQIRLVMVPNAEHVREVIDYYQAQATPNQP